MSKHHAVDDEPQATDESWIRGLAKPTDTSPTVTNPYYASLVARAPRHAATDHAGDAAAAAAQTAPIQRISASRMDTVIGRLDDLVSSKSRHASPDETPADEARPDEAPTGKPTDGTPTGEIPTDETPTGEIPTDEARSTERLRDELQAGARHAGEPRSASTSSNMPGPVTPGAAGALADEIFEVQDGTPLPARVRPLRGRLRKPVLVGAAATLCLLTLGGGTIGGIAAARSEPPITSVFPPTATGAAGSATGAAVTASSAADSPIKTVSIVVDGEPRQVSTSGDSVAAALAAAGISASGHDALSPGAHAAISDGSKIVLDRGRLLTLTVDGRPRQVWTTARTLGQALAGLGAQSSNLAVAANRSRPIPLGGVAVTASTTHRVRVSVAGNSPVAVTTTAKSVGQLLVERGLVLGKLDTVSPAQATPLIDGLLVAVDRVAVSSSSETVPLIQPPATMVNDPAMAKGTSKVVSQGHFGELVVTYQLTTENGKRTARAERSRHTVVAPAGTITHVGTKTGLTYVGSEVFTNDRSFGVNWDGLAFCESTHNPKAVNANPSAGLPTYGLFQ
ncbi:MAG: ubiquitin-like domain-containing protein, partial [Actinomycetota bacterium]|nr:ubiquitin-like domain-containing protein [Actinomycetota bacterium]